MSEASWTPRPDPALTDPSKPGLRPHRHPPDHLHGWVFLQQQVWVDYWGNEHEIELMPNDYVANVIGFCEKRARRIAVIVWFEITYRELTHQLGPGRALSADPLRFRLDLTDIAETSDADLRAWLHELPLLQALNRQLRPLADEESRQ